MRLIDADALKHTLCELERRAGFGTVRDSVDGFKLLTDHAPTVDAVPVKSIEQLKWERDTAIQQLEEHGVPFCGKADVVSVVRCKDCRYWWGESEQCMDEMGFARKWKADDYCSNGERQEE